MTGRIERFLFPLKSRPIPDYKSGARFFGAGRANGGRIHAGCDLIAPAGTEVLAVADGKIVRFAPFYLGTWSLEVNHGNFTVRYSEVAVQLPQGLNVGSRVKRGDVIAYVGLMTSNSQMLHLELYGNDAKGSLTQPDNLPYMRRADLLDPTKCLDEAEMYNKSSIILEDEV